MRILVVNPDDLMQEAIADLLTNKGHAVAKAKNCSEARALLSNELNRFDLIVSDEQGLSIYADTPRIPVIILVPMERPEPAPELHVIGVSDLPHRFLSLVEKIELSQKTRG